MPAMSTPMLEEPGSGLKEEDPATSPEEWQRLRASLVRLKLTAFAEKLEGLGVEVLGDLAYVLDADLEKLGMPMVPRRKLLEAAGSDWRASLQANAKEADRPALCSEGASAASAELELLQKNVARFVEEFCFVNRLGANAQTELLELQPRAALRAMGLLGRGNAFAMQGVRRPSAAARARARAAASVEALGASIGHDRDAGLPFEDWHRLLEGFAQANGLSAGSETLDALRGLSREQALRVMGFTSGLTFQLSPEARSAEEEVAERVRAALAGGAMPEGVPRLRQAPEREFHLLARASPGRSAGPPICSRSRSLSPQSEEEGGSSASGSGSSRSPQRAPLRRVTRRSRSRSRGRPVGSSPGAVPRGAVAGSGEPAPLWKRNLEDFIQINELDERSARALSEVSKLYALHVMGLVGRENSFVIRGVRNASAAVMHRLQKVQEQDRAHGLPVPSDSEYFAQLPRLVEDFVSVNDFDTRGIDAVRTLRPEVAMKVMGFTAENAFLIRGVKNPSAALIARIAVAQRQNPRGPGRTRSR